MARPLRVEYPGAVYHVTARGNERRRTFRDDRDRERFLETLAEAARQHGLLVHGYCLMPNHYHLLVETPRGNLSRGIGWLQTTYTIRFNRRHRRSGHLFQGRFKAHLVEADSYAMELLRYVHLNPVRPRDKTAPVPVERRQTLNEYCWSSHRAYRGKAAAPGWLCTDWLSFFGRKRHAAQHDYGKFISQAFGTVVESPWAQLQGGLVLGSDGFFEQIRELIGKKVRAEEVHWVSRTEDVEARQAAARQIARQQTQRSWQIWVRVDLGGERRIEVARAYGYSDGSAITQALKRLQQAAQADRAVQKRMTSLRTLIETEMSSVKIWCAREAGVSAGESPVGAIRRFSTADRANCVAARRGGEQARNRTGRS